MIWSGHGNAPIYIRCASKVEGPVEPKMILDLDVQSVYSLKLLDDQLGLKASLDPVKFSDVHSIIHLVWKWKRPIWWQIHWGILRLLDSLLKRNGVLRTKR